MKRLTTTLLCLAALAAPSEASAQLRFDAVQAARREARGNWARLGSTPSARVSVVVRHSAAAELGLIPISDEFSVTQLSPDDVAGFRATHPEAELLWAPPRRPLLDRSAAWTRVGEVRSQSDSGGQGAIVGIVDTGIDPTHPDFRDASGQSRIAWVLDFSQYPVGAHPELEAQLGCSENNPCAVFSQAELNQYIANPSDLTGPQDIFGHGTHVASLAAGNGGPTGRYVGVAPEAELIIVRGDRGNSGAFLDGDILLGTKFIFDRAQEMGLPAVVNLSLGSDFGPHDGSSELGQGLASMVGDERPGRSIVVAAGNSGGVYVGVSDDYPGPFGTHTEVHVPRESSVRVPLLSPPTGGTTNATIFVWIATRPGDDLRVGLDDSKGEWVEPQKRGTAGTFSKGDLDVTLFNGSVGGSSPLTTPNGAVMVIDGSWKSGETFALRFEGHGTPRLWIQSEGDLGPGVSTGALFPRGRKEGTINIPAAHPDLIAVGATLNRLDWPTRDGFVVEVASFGSVDDPPLDSAAFFSSAGPSANGLMKPDISAPGAFLVAAMATLADPSNGVSGIFRGDGVCDLGNDCLVTDAEHAVTSGTSMASPQVAGAVALLLARDPTLTQRQVLTLLQAGARRPEGLVPVEQQVGAGALDVAASLEAQAMDDSILEREPSSAESWLSLSSSFAHPDESWVVEALLELRDEEGRIADGFDRSQLKLELDNGIVVRRLQRIAPGLWRAHVAAGDNTGGDRLRIVVRYGQDALVVRDIPIGTDPNMAWEGASARGGTCGINPARSGGSERGLVVLLGLPLWLRRRRRAQMSTRCAL